MSITRPVNSYGRICEGDGDKLASTGKLASEPTP